MTDIVSGFQTLGSHDPGGVAIQVVPLDVLSEDQMGHLVYQSENYVMPPISKNYKTFFEKNELHKNLNIHGIGI